MRTRVCGTRLPNGASSGARSYDVTAFRGSGFRIRFRIDRGYQSSNETFSVDDVPDR